VRCSHSWHGSVLRRAAYSDVHLPQPLTLEELANQVCQQFSLQPDAVRSASSQRSLTAARVAIAIRAVDGRVACLAEVAAFMNREPGSLSELLRRHRRRG
jgi:hypothetical protein